MSEISILSISLSVAIGLFYIILNLTTIADVKFYYIIAKDLKRGVYSYHQTLGDQIYFKRNNVGSLYAHDKKEIIFFPNDGIKVMEGVYLHKSLIWTSIFGMYYYWKLNKIKDRMIREHKIRESFRQIRVEREERMYNVYVKKHNSSFKFFRG